jgi:hypothetical protein
MTAFFGRLLHHPWALGLGTTGLTAGIIMLQHHVKVIMDPASTEEARTEAGYALAGDCALVVSGLLAYGHAINNAYNEWCEQEADAGGAHGGADLGHAGGLDIDHDASDHDGSDHETIEMGQSEDGSGQGSDHPNANQLANAVTVSSEGLGTLAAQLGQEQDALPQLQILIVPDAPGGQQQPVPATTAPTGQDSPPPSNPTTVLDPVLDPSDSESEHLIYRPAEPLAQQQPGAAPGMTQVPPAPTPAEDTRDTPAPLAHASSGEKGPGGTGADTN